MFAETRDSHTSTFLTAAICVLGSIPAIVRAGDPPCLDDCAGISVCLQWYEELGTAGQARAASVDVMGNVVAAGDTYTGNPNLPLQIYAAKFDVAGNANCANAPLWSATYPSPATGQNYGHSIGLDLEGNSYVAGRITDTNAGSHSNGSIGVIKLYPDGYRAWSRVVAQPSGGAVEGTLGSIAVDPEGVLYVAGLEKNAGGVENWLVARLSSLTGATLWAQRFDPGNNVGGFQGDGPRQIIVDRRGNPIVTGQADVDDPIDIVTMRLDPNDGHTVWTAVEDDPATNLYEFNPRIGSDLDCNVFVAGSHESNADFQHTQIVTVKYSSDGMRLWRRAYSATNEAQARDLAVGAAGDVYVTGFTENASTPGNRNYVTLKYGPNGGPPIWNQTYNSGGTNSLDIAYAITLDFLDNAYVTGTTPNGSNQQITTIKYAADDGAVAPDWPVDFDTGNGSALGVDIVVDYGGGVYVVGSSGSDTDHQKFLVLRYKQAGASIPEVATIAPNFQIERASVWDPDIPSFLVDYPIWEESWDEETSLGGFDAGFGAELTLETDGHFELGFRAEASLGYFDATYPGTATIRVNNAQKLALGQPINISTSWELDPCARITSNSSPTLDAGVIAGIDGAVGNNLDAVAHLEIEAFGATVFDDDLFNISFSVPINYILSLLELLPGEFSLGSWTDFEDPTGVFTGEVRFPRIAASGGPDGAGVLQSSAEELFFTLQGNVTTLLMTLIGRSNSIEAESDFFNVAITFFELFLRSDLSIVQDLGLKMQPQGRSMFHTPLVTLQFRRSNGNLFATRTVNLGESVTDVNVPATGDGIVNITPIVKTDCVFQNYTGLSSAATLGFDTVSPEATVHVGDIDLASWSACFFCYEYPLGMFPVNLYGSPASPRQWPIEFPQYTADVITVVADVQTTLAAASRTSATMLIYDQINPQQSSFNAVVNESFQMLLYGDGFTPTAQASIRHYGRIEEVDTTYLNNNTLLVEIPNRFRLLPGVARIFVDTDRLPQSNSIDFTFEYPAPHLATVNPNLWAADPDLATIPVAVIDGFTPAGRNSYIARRDYFIKMRDQLWNNSTAGGVGAEAYFPNFDFDEPPAFPLVSFNGMPMPRFVQPVDNGIHNIRLPDFAYASPGVTPVYVANPVPGGGMSNVINLTIAAPCPVISGLNPPAVAPDSPEFTLEVMGPAHVPTWDGFEEPKFGNFNASSVVRWDGIGLPTKYVNSSSLQASVTADRLTDFGSHQVTVFTPANGSEYFEQLMIDPNGDGEPEIFWQGNIPSGCRVIDVVAGDPTLQCESAPMVFDVTYPAPAIDAVSPETIAQCSSAFNNPAETNYSVQGRNFAPGATVYVNGVLRTTTRVSDTLLNVTLLSKDVANVGTLNIYVTNPPPSGGQSNVRQATVVILDCNGNGASDPCEIAAGTAQDCNDNTVPDSCDIANGTSMDADSNGIPDECRGGLATTPAEGPRGRCTRWSNSSSRPTRTRHGEPSPPRGLTLRQRLDPTVIQSATGPPIGNRFVLKRNNSSGT